LNFLEFGLEPNSIPKAGHDVRCTASWIFGAWY